MTSYSFRLGKRALHTHHFEAVQRLRRVAVVSDVKLIPNCNPTICTTCRLRALNERLASPFQLVSDLASVALAVGASSIIAGPSGVLAIRRRA